MWQFSAVGAEGKYLINYQTGHAACVLSESELDNSWFELIDCADLKEETEEALEYNTELQAKYPCPDSLEFVKHLMHTKVNVIGSNNLCLFNDGAEKAAGFRTRHYNKEHC